MRKRTYEHIQFGSISDDFLNIGNDIQCATYEVIETTKDEELALDAETTLINGAWIDPDILKRLEIIQPGSVKRIMLRSEEIEAERHVAELASISTPTFTLRGLVKSLRKFHF